MTPGPRSRPQHGRTVVAAVAAGLLVQAGPLTGAAAAAPATTLVSASGEGTTGDLASGTFGLSVSGDGSTVAFASLAGNLHPDDTDRELDVYVKDLSTGAVVLASAPADGPKADQLSLRPSLDGTGARVAFASAADNLDPDDPDLFADIYVKDLLSGDLELASVGELGKGHGDSTGAALSADGRSVAFLSRAPDLHDGDRDALLDVFVKDLDSGALHLATTTPDGRKGQPGPYGVGKVSLSADGTRLAFDTDARLSASDTDAAPDVYVKDLTTGGLVLASLGSSGGDSAQGSYRPSLSADGFVVAFDSSSADLSPADTDEEADVYVKDLRTGELTVASRSGTAKGDARSTSASLSADGRQVAFASNATNLAAGDPTGVLDVYVKDLQTGAVTLASATPEGTAGAALSLDPSLAGDGSVVAFASQAADLVAEDDNGVTDVFARHLVPLPPEDETPPSVTLAATLHQTWGRPSVTVDVHGTASDEGSGIAAVELEVEDEYGVAVPSVAPVDGSSRDSVCFTRSLLLPASTRHGDLDGREYTVTAVVTDVAGNATSEHLHVHVRRHRDVVVTQES